MPMPMQIIIGFIFIFIFFISIISDYVGASEASGRSVVGEIACVDGFA